MDDDQTRVYIMKAEARGLRERDNSENVPVFVSKSLLATICEPSSDFHTIGRNLSETANNEIVEKGGHAQSSTFAGRELSKELLQELSEKARTRAEIKADQEKHESI